MSNLPSRAAGAFTLGWLAALFALWIVGGIGASARQLVAMTAMAYLACWVPFFAIAPHSRRQKAIRFFVFNASLLTAFAVTEVGAKLVGIDFRHVFGNRVQPWENTKNLRDRELIHIHRPHYQEKGQLKGGGLSRAGIAPAITVLPYDLKYDRHGFRNSVDYDTVDYIVIGDSFVEGADVSSDELLTNQIAEDLGVSVANLGQSYYGPQQELIVLRRFGISLRPKTCIWIFFEGNDLKDIWRYRDFIASWPQSVAKYASWKERSLIKNAFVWLGKRLNGALHSPTTDKSGLFSADHGQQRLWFGYYGSEMTAQDVSALEITAATISEAYALCKQQGIQLIVAFAPTKYRVYADQCVYEDDSPIQNWVVNRLPTQLSEAIRTISSEIGFVDLTESLKEAARSGQVVYYPDDTHWSPQGHAIVGAAISEYIRRHFKPTE